MRDPELDTDVVTLDFVGSCSVSDDGVAHVRLRLPTYFCAPNFAFLMVADAWDAVSAGAGSAPTSTSSCRPLRLRRHQLGRGGAGGLRVLDGRLEPWGRPSTSCTTCVVRSPSGRCMAGTDLVVRPLMRAGTTPEELVAMTLGDAPPSDDLPRLRARRRELGIPAGDDAPLVVDPAGAARWGSTTCPCTCARRAATRSASTRTPASAAVSSLRATGSDPLEHPGAPVLPGGRARWRFLIAANALFAASSARTPRSRRVVAAADCSSRPSP